MLLGALTAPEIFGIISASVLVGATVFPFAAKLLARAGLRSTASSTVAIYEANNKALRERNEIHEQEITDLRADLTRANSKIKQQDEKLHQQQQQIDTLRELVLQTSAVSEMQEQMSHMEARLIDKIGDTTKAVVEKMEEEHSTLAALVTSGGKREA